MKNFLEFDEFDAILEHNKKLSDYKAKLGCFEDFFKLSAVVLAGILLIFSVPHFNTNLTSIYLESMNYPFSLFVFEVGSGSCALLHSDECNVLVDCGKEIWQFDILDIFDYLDIDKLDLMILTHPDKDHIGDMAEVAENVEIDRFVTCENGDYELTEYYENLLKTLELRDIEVEAVKAGDRISFGDVVLDVVSPTKVYNSTNNNSVVVKVSYNGFTALLTGDAGKAAESDILSSGYDISANVLQVAHHGSGSSTTEEFLEAVDPDCALISVYQSDYLPNDYTLGRLIDYGCDVFRTDVSGSILVAVNENGDFRIYKAH